MADHDIDETEIDDKRTLVPEAVADEAAFDEDVLDEAEFDDEGEIGPELADGGVVRRLFAEFLGAFFLALVIAVASGPVAPALVGLAAAMLFFLFGPVSGGHFNPVVTAAMGLLGRIRAELAWVYLFVQFAAGFAAFALVWALRPPLDDAARAALRGSVDHLAGAEQGQVPWFPAQWPLLILLPALLVAAVLAARGKFGQEPSAAAWIGVAVGATFWLEGAIYPAASLPAVVFNGYVSAFRALPVLLLFPLIGAYAGALLYRELIAPRPVFVAEDEEDEESDLVEADEPELAADEPELADEEFDDKEPEPVGKVLDEQTAAELAASTQEDAAQPQDSQPHQSS